MKKNDKIRKDADILTEAPAGAEVNDSTAPKKKRRFNRRSLFKVMFVVSIIFIMISLTYAWFSSSETAHVNGLDVEVTDPNNLIADGIFAKGKIDSIAGNGTSFYKPEWERKLVGKNGDYNLYKLAKSGVYQPLENDVVATESVANDLLVVDFSLTITGKHNIYMINGSGVKPEGEGAEFLEGAIRVAVMKLNEETQQYELCLIWLPDVTSVKNGGSDLDGSLTVVYPDGDSVKEETFTVNSEHGEDTFNGVRYVWGKIDGNNENNVLVGELDGTAKYRCVVWLDGNDRECDNELLDRDIVATFKFIPEPIVEESTAE